MTISKKVRAHLAKYPNSTAREIQEKYGCSIAMAYRLFKEFKESTDDLKIPQRLLTREELIQSVFPEAAKQQKQELEKADNVNHPAHYKVGGIETIDFIEAKGLHQHYHLANAIKYISRAPYKNNYLEDLKKAVWYLQRELNRESHAA